MEVEKSLFDYFSLQEVRKNFSLDELCKLAKEKNLSEWLESNFYEDESRKISDAVENKIGDAELKLLICKIFNFDLESLSAYDVEKISAVVAKNQRQELFFEKREDDGRKAAYVENQRELIQALKDGAEVIYLYAAEFKIPTNFNNKTYIGRCNAVIDFDSDGDIDFDERNIIFEDLQIFLHYPIILRMNNSKNVKVIDGGRKFLGAHLTLKEIFDIMRGRGAFESAENFSTRAEKVIGVAVGTALLKDKNYFYDHASFKFSPQWNFDYISVLKDFAKGRDFFIELSPTDAELLYNNERKLQIFADFANMDGKLTILNLYFDTKTLGRIFIKHFLRNKISSGSGFGGLGYGLDIITAYKQTDEEVF